MEGRGVLNRKGHPSCPVQRVKEGPALGTLLPQSRWEMAVPWAKVLVLEVVRSRRNVS